MYKLSGIPHIFPESQWFIIGIGHSDISTLPVSACKHTQFLRTHVLRIDPFTRMCNFMVLTKRAAKIAAIASDRKNAAARMKLCQWLFFDWIECYRRDLSIV